MRIALAQTPGFQEPEENLAVVADKAREAAGRGASLVVFPEASSQAFGTGRLDTRASGLDGEFPRGVLELSSELGITIVAGIFRPADTVERGEKTINRVSNTALIAASGEAIVYDKIHTFDALGNRESDTVRPGSELVTFSHGDATVGVAVCFDIRYPEQFRELARRGAELIVVPTSWASGEGKLEQWRVLTRARALDSGAFILAADHALPDGPTKGPTGIGHSVAVAPNGTVLAEAGEGPELLVVDIDPAAAAEQRRELPIL